MLGPMTEAEASLAHRLLSADRGYMLSKIHDPLNLPQNAPVIDPGIVDSKRLQMFYVSVTEGSFAAAAQMLSVSPSAISHAMKALEEDFGCALFRRAGPQVKPTGAAMRLLPLVEDMLLKISSMKSELAAIDGRSDHLTVRIPAAMTGMLEARVLSTFYECFPGAQLKILLADEKNHEDSSASVDFDINYQSRVPAGMVRRDLCQEELHAYAAPFHSLGQKSRVSVSELKHSLLIFPDWQTFEWLSQQFLRGGNENFRPWLVPDYRLGLELARQGQGIVFLPEWAVNGSVRSGELVCLKIAGLEFRRECCAWWPPSRPLTWVAEVFLSLVVARIEERTGQA